MSFIPFTLQALINNVTLEDNQQGGNKDSKVTAESVEALENNLYIGTSDGQLIHYLYDQISSED
ncbi:35111_t:CDS:2, partial [Gigaspora margarita]